MDEDDLYTADGKELIVSFYTTGTHNHVTTIDLKFGIMTMGFTCRSYNQNGLIEYEDAVCISEDEWQIIGRVKGWKQKLEGGRQAWQKH